MARLISQATSVAVLEDSVSAPTSSPAATPPTTPVGVEVIIPKTGSPEAEAMVKEAKATSVYDEYHSPLPSAPSAPSAPKVVAPEPFKSEVLNPLSEDYKKLSAKFGWEEIRVTHNFTACRIAGVPAWFKGRRAFLGYVYQSDSYGRVFKTCVGSFFPATPDELAAGKHNTWSINGVWSGIEYVDSNTLGEV